MRQKELRIALVCYGGISLAVYMHGVTKELWKVLRASQVSTAGLGNAELGGTEAVYAELLDHIASEYDLNLRVLVDIVAGASAGGINSIFLAQAIHSGQSLEPLTELWLERADVDVLLDPDARPLSKFAKFWAMPLVSFVLSQPGNVISDSVAPETRAEVREKLSRLIRSRWFEAPFGGLGFSRLLYEALASMGKSDPGPPLLPPDHPIDLFVTATDFKGHLETLHLNSPPLVQESEHRISLGFRGITPTQPGQSLASLLELVFAARATASFPGAFPALQVSEIDELKREHEFAWENREDFLKRIMPEHYRRGELDSVSLIDGSVLVNAPFEDAMSVLRDRPALHEVDRRFVYIDPRPDRIGGTDRKDPNPPGFFSAIFGSLSSIPREQPIRDNLEEIEQQSTEMATLRSIVHAVRPEVEETVEKLFGRTLFFDRPTPKRLASWRAKAQDAACLQSGYSYHGYAQVKFAGIVNSLAKLIHSAAPELELGSSEPIARHLKQHLAQEGLDRLTKKQGGATPETIAFFRAHDFAFRIRRLRLLARRLTQDWQDGSDIADDERDNAREVINAALVLYERCERSSFSALGDEFPGLASRIFSETAPALEHIAKRQRLADADRQVEAMLAEAMDKMSAELRRRMLLTYLGFPFYDAVTLPLLRGEGMTEFDPVKVDRISPDDARSIRAGGAHDTLRGVEFYNFGAFFSRAYRENDYLWGRLHGAERMIDLITSSVPQGETIAPDRLASFKRDAFLAILDEEEGKLEADPSLVPGIRREVLNTLSD
ncbi:MAG: patatin-like protein [Sphingomonadaceae bacterium]|nr:patatin-like protein [Sphingomonadaceae bacterium]